METAESVPSYVYLGDSNTVMLPSWRMLACFEAANGMLMFAYRLRCCSR